MSTAIGTSSHNGNHAVHSNTPTTQLIQYSASSPTVDYDTNVTPLYAAIGNSNWDQATSICETILNKLNSGENVVNEAATWVVRKKGNEILWRFLPIHSSCALSPPHAFLRLLIKLSSSSVRTMDHQGLLPLHYACGSQSSREVIYTLLMSFPQAALSGDPRGMLPLHYLGQWGPQGGSSGIVEMMLVATGEMANAKDKDGNTPLKLAQNASYFSHNEVANQIANHIMRKGLHLSNSINNSPSSSKYVNTRYNPKERYASFEDETTMDSNMMDKSNRSGNNLHHAMANMVSFGDLLEDEERETESINTGDRGREVRDSVEISFGRDRTPRGNQINSTLNKLGISPVNTSYKSKLNQQGDNRSILSDPLNNNRIVSSPRRIDQVAQNNDNTTDPNTPKTTHRRTFSWDVDPNNSSDGNSHSYSSITNAIIDKYASPRHTRDPTARGGLPPMSPQATSQSQNNPNISRDDYENVKSQLRVLKLEKEHLENERKSDFMENNRKIQSDFRERLEKEGREKKVLEERHVILNEELEKGKRRIAELESQLSEVRSFGNNAAATFGKDAYKYKETIAKLEQENTELKEKVANHESSDAALDAETKKSASLEAQVKEQKTKIDDMQRTHGEAVYNHLQEVRSLRSSLERATEDIEKTKSLKLELDSRDRKHKDELSAKEKEWGEERARLQAQISNSRQDASTVSSDERSKLELQVRSLTEASWSAQNAEYAIKADLCKKEMEWREERAKLEAEIERLKETAGGSTAGGYSVASSFFRTNNCDDNHSDMNLDSAMKEAEEMRKYNANIRKEHDQTIIELESELDKERTSKRELMSEIVSLQYKVSRLESDLEEGADAGVEVLYGSRKYRRTGISGSESVDQSTDNVRQATEAREQIRKLEDHVQQLRKDLDDALSKKYKSEEESNSKEKFQREEIAQLEEKIRILESREKQLKSELSDMDEFKKTGFDQDRIYQQLRSVKIQLTDIQEREDCYLREIRDLKKQISELEALDQGLDAKLWEAQRSQQWALQEKEDELNGKIRDIKKEYENTIINNQNKHLKELRELKRDLQRAFSEKEDNYMQQLRDAKRREQALQDREDDLIKQMNDVQLKSSLDDLDIDGMLRQKDEEFGRLLEEASQEKTAKIAELIEQVKSLEQELGDSEDARLIKKELEQQRRKHKSEINKLQNSLDLQKSKEARLQSHIKSMESQITGMVSDYEARLEEAYYATAAVKGALK